VIQSGEDICTEVEKWRVVNRQWKFILDSNEFWVSVLEQLPFRWWDTDMAAHAFFQMFCRLTALQREKILELTITTTTIEYDAFAGANLSGLISLPPGLTTIGEDAFAGANLSGLTSLPPGLTTIEDDAFMGANLSGLISLPPGLTKIGDFAFADANLSGLKSFPLWLATTTIGDFAFANADLSGLTSLPP
jgi:hypothetical protein